MKFIQLALLAFLLCSFSVTATKIRSQSHSSFSLGGILRSIRSFLVGCCNSLSGGTSGVYNCLPASWKSRPSSRDNPNGNDVSSFSSSAQSVIKVIGKVIRVACKFKSIVMKFFGGKRRLFFLKRRFFLLTGRRWGFFKKIWHHVKKAAHHVVHAVKHVVSKVAGAAKWLANKIGSAALAVLKGITRFVKNIINKIKAFFKSPFMQKMIFFFKCLMKGRTAIKNAIRAIRGFISRIRELATGIPGVVKFVIDMICNFNCFVKAVDYVISAIRHSGNRRAEDFGRFVCKLVYCIGTA